MIKAVIFDCFGVLTTEGFRVFCSEHFSDDPQKHAEAQAMMDESCLGKMPHGVFAKKLAELAGVSPKTVLEYLNSNMPNRPLFKYIKDSLKPKYKIGLLSNASADWLNQLFDAKDIELFDDRVLSFELGVVKPDPIIYETAAARLGLKTNECVLVDDVDRYREGAQAVGMQAIWYRDFPQMKSELEQLLKVTR